MSRKKRERHVWLGYWFSVWCEDDPAVHVFGELLERSASAEFEEDVGFAITRVGGKLVCITSDDVEISRAADPRRWKDHRRSVVTCDGVTYIIRVHLSSHEAREALIFGYEPPESDSDPEIENEGPSYRPGNYVDDEDVYDDY